MKEFEFNLGDELKDEITGFVGVCTSRTQWLNACNVYGLQPKELKDGKPQERCHFDEPQLELVKKTVYKSNRETGGIARSVPQSNR